MGLAAAVEPVQLAAGSGPPEYLTAIAALVVAAAVIGYACARLRIVPIVGFLLAGVLIGPNALGVVREREVIDAAADVGVILLLFTIGIEFSLGRLHGDPAARPARRLAAGRSARSRLTTGVLVLAGVDLRPAVFTGLLVALSSTALVLKLLGDRGATSSPTGQTALGLLVFQDLAVVAMVLLLPVLARRRGRRRRRRSAGRSATAAVVIVVTLVVARRRHAAGAGGGGPGLLARGVPAVGHRALPRHGLPHRARRASRCRWGRSSPAWS